MKPRNILALAVAAMLAGCGGAPAAPNAPIVLTYASPYPPGHPFSRADAMWIGHVESQLRGRVAIRPFWSGSLISAQESMEEVRHGVADIGLIAPIYARGGAHVQRAQAGFYAGVPSIGAQVSTYKCLENAFPILADELHGLRILAVQGGNSPGIVTREAPVRTLADLKGLRLRAPTENLEVLRALGADPVNMPMGEVYSALAKGVIDGVIAPADTLRNLHLAEVAGYFTTLRISRGAYPARAISRHRWSQLPPDVRTVLADAQPIWERALEREIRASDEAGIAYGRANGITFSPIAPYEQRRFDNLYNQSAARIASGLDRFGADGPAMLATAQRLIARTDTGLPVDCASVMSNRKDPE